MENKVAEIEYPLDNLRLDVVWKTIPTGNPRWVFEVQLAGNFYEALTKLKHAWDKWNSKPFLVTTEEYQDRANQLLEGSFHEMKDDARVVHWKKIMKLYELIKAEQELKRKSACSSKLRIRGYENLWENELQEVNIETYERVE